MFTFSSPNLRFCQIDRHGAFFVNHYQLWETRYCAIFDHGRGQNTSYDYTSTKYLYVFFILLYLICLIWKLLPVLKVYGR